MHINIGSCHWPSIFNIEVRKGYFRHPEYVECHRLLNARLAFLDKLVPDLERNHAWLDQWCNKLVQWLKEGREPTVFVHSSDNIAAPTLAGWLDEKLQHSMPDYLSQINLPASHEQMGLL